MSDRIAVMQGGKVEQLGTPEELYERPRTRFVADFIGTSNLLSGVVEAIDGRFAIVRLSSGETCRTTSDRVAVGRSIDLSVRPESVALDARNGAEPTDTVGTFSGSIEQVAYLGGSIQYLVRSAGGLSITVHAPKAGHRIPVGGAVDVTWSPGDALVLAEHPDAQEEIPA